MAAAVTEQQLTVELRLRSMPGHAAPPAARLRRLLKSVLRAYGFRALTVREIDVGHPVAPLAELDASKTEPPF
jgi:hypothetical protein